MIRISLLLLLLSSLASAQCHTSTLAGGNGQNGAMFDITNISATAITVTGVDQAYFNAGTTVTYEIYTVTAGTSFIGNETTAANWTLQGTATNVAHPTALVAVPIPIVLSVTIAPGQTLGFYCTTNTDTIAYTNGATPVGTVFNGDGTINFVVGVGKSYPFGATFTPRVWNGVVRYQVVGASGGTWELNSPGSSLDINGVQATSCSKARTGVCLSGSATANLGGAAGLGFDILYNGLPTVPGGFITPGGQIVNLNLTGGFFSLNGGTILTLLPFPGAISIPFTAPPAAGTISFQQLNIDPTNAEGASLSQAAQLDISGTTFPAGPTPGPTGDDTEVALSVGCVSFYSQSFTRVFVESNGRLMFGLGSTTFAVSSAVMTTNNASFGVFCDLNPAAGGSITINSPAAGVLDVAYAGVTYFGGTGTATFNLALDTNTGIASIIGLNTIGTGTGQQLIGISGGIGIGAVDAGPTIFSPAGAPSFGSALNLTNMTYQLGTQGGVTSGITRIDFLPNVIGSFDWLSS